MVGNKIQTIPRSWLVGEWLLDGNAYDTNDGTKNNGTATNVTWANTDIGYQYQNWSFNGSSSLVSAASPMTTWQTTPFSISTWINYSNTTRSWIVNKYNQNDTVKSFVVELEANQTTNKITYWVWSYATSDQVFNSSATLTSWTWYHLVFTHAADKSMQLYINWVLDSTNSHTYSDTSTNTSPLTIWCRRYWSAQTTNLYFAWSQQWVRMYNRVLSKEEISALYIEWQKKLWWESYNDLMRWLIWYWDFNGDANDVMSWANGTVTWATLTTDRLWLSNRAYSYTSNTCSIDSMTIPAISTWEYTISWMFYPAVAATSWDYNIVWRWSTGVANEEPIYMYYWWYWTNQYRVLMQNTANTTFWNTYNKTFSANTWYHITITVWWGNLKVYFDGVLDQTLAYTWTAYTRTTWFAIGNRWYNRNEGWEGKINHTMLFNRALSAWEVKSLYDLSNIKYLMPF